MHLVDLSSVHQVLLHNCVVIATFIIFKWYKLWSQYSWIRNISCFCRKQIINL